MILLRRLLVALVALVATWFGVVSPAAAAAPSADRQVSFAYDSHTHAADRIDTATERGPPAVTYDFTSPSAAVGPSSYGPSSHPQSALSWAHATYDQPVQLPPVDSATVAARAVGHAAGVCAFPGASVAAKIGARACSFAGATTVLMADGSRKPIKDIEVGDKVIATDPETGEQVAKRVEHVWVHDDTVIDLVVDGEVITTTEDHPFWSVTDQRFERADELEAGEKVRGADGRAITVSQLRVGTERQALAYNLSVEGIHTYHVGETEILVHNVCPPMLGANATQVTSKTSTPWNRPYRIDVENPAPGSRPGQLHLQQGDQKYLYDFGAGEFPELPNSLARTIARDPAVARAIEKGRVYLGLAE